MLLQAQVDLMKRKDVERRLSTAAIADQRDHRQVRAA